MHRAYRAVKRWMPSSMVNSITDLTIKNAHIPWVSVKELESNYEMALKHLQSLNVELGDYLDFGVSYGTSMVCMHRILTKLKLGNVRMIGFDSFQGLPDSAATEDGGIWKPGQFASPIQQTYEHLNKNDIDWRRTLLVRGWFENTLNKKTAKTFNLNKASVIMIDCDLYSSSRDALNFCLPMIKDYAIIFFDDWRDDVTVGECKAYTEFLEQNDHLHSSALGTYDPDGKIFLVRNTRTVGQTSQVHSITLVPLFIKAFWQAWLY